MKTLDPSPSIFCFSGRRRPKREKQANRPAFFCCSFSARGGKVMDCVVSPLFRIRGSGTAARCAFWRKRRSAIHRIAQHHRRGFFPPSRKREKKQESGEGGRPTMPTSFPPPKPGRKGRKTSSRLVWGESREGCGGEKKTGGKTLAKNIEGDMSVVFFYI